MSKPNAIYLMEELLGVDVGKAKERM